MGTLVKRMGSYCSFISRAFDEKQRGWNRREKNEIESIELFKVYIDSKSSSSPVARVGSCSIYKA